MDTMEMRRNAIAELVNKHGTVSFAQIKEQFPQVSEMTLRTDLKALDAAKEIVRIHGGAKSVQLVIGTDDYLTRRAVRNIGADLLTLHEELNLSNTLLPMYFVQLRIAKVKFLVQCQEISTYVAYRTPGQIIVRSDHQLYGLRASVYPYDLFCRIQCFQIGTKCHFRHLRKLFFNLCKTYGSMFIHQFRNCISAHFHCIHNFLLSVRIQDPDGIENSDSSYFSVIKFAIKCV